MSGMSMTKPVTLILLNLIRNISLIEVDLEITEIEGKEANP